jgi:cytochrome bd-type quinol oxidase subunit 2
MEETTEKPTVLNTGIRYGLYLALASIALMLIITIAGGNPLQNDFKSWSTWVNFAVSIAIIVLAHKYFKDNGDGFMSFGQGFGIAFVAFMVSIAIAGVFTYVYANFIDKNLMEDIWNRTAEQMEQQGQSDETIEVALNMTKKLFWVFYLIGGGFGAAVISLIVSIFTQKRNPNPIG